MPIFLWKIARINTKLRVVDRAYAPLKIERVITNELAITWTKISQMEICMSAISMLIDNVYQENFPRKCMYVQAFIQIHYMKMVEKIIPQVLWIFLNLAKD